ncbi:MAG: dihydrolipoamide acetyltransferase family protein [Thermomicrobiales bacterium]
MPTETATTITMPQLGESVTEGTIGAWLKQVGDQVEKYDLLVEVETDKVNTEIPSPVAGVLVEILIDPTTTVPVGTALCRIDQAETGGGGYQAPRDGSGDAAESAGVRTANGHDAATRAVPATASNCRRTGEIADEMELLRARSSPVVRRIAEEHGVDITKIDGSGVGGRVTKQDILAFVERAPEAVTDRAMSVIPPAAPPRGTLATAERAQVQVFPGDEVIPVTPMRRQIAEHMVRSERTAPHVTCVMEVDMTNVVAYRVARKEGVVRREGVDLTYIPFAIKAATLALRDHPRLNAVWDEERIIHRGAINVGIAVALDDGLIVPVIKHADRLSIAGLMHAVAELAAKARAGTLKPDEVTGGTFTINNPGTFGSLVSTPILVQPQVAILSTEAIIKRPVVIDDMIAIRSMMNLSLSVDHRAVDGLAATRFLQAVKRWLEGVDDGLPLY